MFGHLFHLPGGFILLLVYEMLPDIARFFEISYDFSGGWASGIISAICWISFSFLIAD